MKQVKDTESLEPLLVGVGVETRPLPLGAKSLC